MTTHTAILKAHSFSQSELDPESDMCAECGRHFDTPCHHGKDITITLTTRPVTARSLGIRTNTEGI
jgi:hypothetical protein